VNKSKSAITRFIRCTFLAWEVWTVEYQMQSCSRLNSSSHEKHAKERASYIHMYHTYVRRPTKVVATWWDTRVIPSCTERTVYMQHRLFPKDKTEDRHGARHYSTASDPWLALQLNKFLAELILWTLIVLYGPGDHLKSLKNSLLLHLNHIIHNKTRVQYVMHP
jgi:hypothetical protein